MFDKFKISCLGIMIVLSGFGFVFMSQPVLGTEVSGNIAATTTWDTAGSPYYITADLTINGGVSLEIVPDAGPVDVIFNGSFNIWIQGYLFVNGTDTNRVTFKSNQPIQAPNQWSTITAMGPNGILNIEHAIVAGGNNGLRLETDNNVIKNTEIFNCTTGIYGTVASHNWIYETNSHDNTNWGMYFTSASENNTVENCIVDNNMMGIQNDAGSNYLRIINTTVSNCGSGGTATAIYNLNSHFGYFDNCTATDNLWGNGIALSSSNWNTVSNCTALTNGYSGVSTNTAFNNTIINNNFSGNSMSNIKLESSGYNLVDNNTATVCQWGIDMIIGSNYNIISNNSFVDNNGVSLDLGCNNNTIRDNYIRAELTIGLRITSASSDNIVINNTVAEAPAQGISIEGSATRNIVTENTIIDNYNIGVRVTGTAFDNHIYHNNFFNNTQHGYDDTGVNFWNITYSQVPLEGGNYWDNYTGNDVNFGPAQDGIGSDGIGDTPYLWIESGLAQDNYPLIEPYGGIPPESSVDPIAQYWHNSATVLTASASDVGSGVKEVSLYYRHSVDNIAWNAWTLSGTDITAPSWSFNFNFGPGNGYYEFYTIAEDNATNMEDTPIIADQSCAYDQTNPVSSADNIADYIQLTSPLQINATASDALSGMASVSLWYRYSSNNSAWGGWIEHSTDNSAPWSFNFGFPAGAGYYEFYTRGTDNATNTESSPTSADTSCLYDGTLPSSSVDALSSIWCTETMMINATAIDNTVVASVVLYYRHSDDRGATWNNWTLFGTDTTAPWSWNFDFTDGDGYYQFCSVAEDVAGNQEPGTLVDDIQCIFDNTAPKSNLVAPGYYWWNTNPTNLFGPTLNVSDALSGVFGTSQYYRYSVDNSTWGSWTNGGPFDQGEGYYQFYSISEDNAGNAETAPTIPDVELAYDATAPAISNSFAFNILNSRFNASVTDNMGLDQVRLIYRFGTGTETNVSMDLTSGEYLHTITLADGNYTLYFRIAAVDLAGNWNTIAEKSYEITNADDTDDADDPEDEDTGTPSWLWIVIILVIAMAGVLVFFLIGRKKPDQIVEEMDKQDGYEDSEEAEEESEVDELETEEPVPEEEIVE